AAGANGADGTAGANGAPGPQGPAGQQGPTANVTCTPGKPKGKKKVKVKVTCKVANASASTVSIRLMRHGVTYATGRRVERGGGTITPTTAHRLPSGRYTLVIVKQLDDGTRLVIRERLDL